MDASYAEYYRHLYHQHWWWRSREAMLIETVTRLRPAGGWRTILDIGCGDGLFFPELAKFGEVWGIEPDPSLITSDGPWADRITIASFPEAFETTRQFDLIVMADVLEHLENPVAALARAIELLTRDGRILVTVPALQALWTQHDVLNHHRIRYTKTTLIAQAVAAQAQVLELRYFFAWLAPVKLLTRGIETVFGGRPENPTIPAHFANRILWRWSRIEQRVAAHFDLPFGSSLMAVLAHQERPAQAHAPAVQPTQSHA